MRSSAIRGLRVRTVRVPMTEPHRTASGVVSESPLVLTDAITDQGVVGHSIVFTYTAAWRFDRRRISSVTSNRSLPANPWRLLNGTRLNREIPPASAAGAGRYGARRHRYGALGCTRATRETSQSASSAVRKVGQSLWRDRPRWRSGLRKGRRRSGTPRLQRGQSRNRLTRRNGRLEVIRAIRQPWQQRGHHGRLQSVPHPG